MTGHSYTELMTSLNPTHDVEGNICQVPPTGVHQPFEQEQVPCEDHLHRGRGGIENKHSVAVEHMTKCAKPLRNFV